MSNLLTLLSNQGRGQPIGGGGGDVPVPVWTPASVPDLVAWWDFSDIDQLFQDESKSTPVASDGDVIGACADKSGQGNDILQATNGNRPLYKTNRHNSLSAALFDDTDDYLDVGNSMTTATSSTVFTVVAVPGSADSCQVGTADEGGTSRYLRLNVNQSGNWWYYRQRNAGTTDELRVLHGIGGGAGTAFLNTISSDGSTISLRLNGAPKTLAVSSGENGGDWFGDVSNRDNFTVGALLWSGGLNSPYDGDICEILVYDSVPSVTDRGLIEAFFATKWGLTLA